MTPTSEFPPTASADPASLPRYVKAQERSAGSLVQQLIPSGPSTSNTLLERASLAGAGGQSLNEYFYELAEKALNTVGSCRCKVMASYGSSGGESRPTTTGDLGVIPASEMGTEGATSSSPGRNMIGATRESVAMPTAPETASKIGPQSPTYSESNASPAASLSNTVDPIPPAPTPPACASGEAQVIQGPVGSPDEVDWALDTRQSRELSDAEVLDKMHWQLRAINSAQLLRRQFEARVPTIFPEVK